MGVLLGGVPNPEHEPPAVIRSGDALLVKDAAGNWRPATAASGVEGVWKDGRKVHDFPVVYVLLAAIEESVPWPAEFVVLASEVSDVP